MIESGPLLRNDIGDANVILFHSRLDDAGLPAEQFRVYVHLACHAGRGIGCPSVNSMAKVCRMDRKTVMQAIRVLEERGMILARRRPGVTTQYTLTQPSEWRPVPEMDRSVLGTGPSEVTHHLGRSGDATSLLGAARKRSAKKTHFTSPDSTKGKKESGQAAKEGWIVPKAPLALRIHELFRRRPGSGWEPKWVKAYKQGIITTGLTDADMDLIEAYYEHERAKGDEGWHRREMKTFLNNLSGELDRARAYSAQYERSTGVHRSDNGF